MARLAFGIRLREAVQSLALLPRALRLVWAAAPRLSAFWLLLLSAQGILPAAVIYLTKLTVESLVVVSGAPSGGPQLQHALLMVGLTGSALLLGEVLQSVAGWVRTAQAELVHDHVASIVHRQSLALDMAHFERAEFHDRLEQARSEAAGRSRALLETLGGLLQHGITLVAMTTVLAPYGLWLPAALLVSTLPALGVVAHFDRVYHRWWQGATPRRRKAQYYDMLMTHSATAAEVRAYSLGEFLQQSYRGLRSQLRGELLAHLRRQNLGRLGAGAFALLTVAGAMGWMVTRMVAGVASLGDLVLFYQAFSRGQDVVRSLLGSAGQLYGHTLFISNLFAFLELQPEVREPTHSAPVPATIARSLNFRGVTFTYPGAARPALHNFHLTVPAGGVVAIVGPNGAGKSTLVKLLQRFYDPQQGRIDLDGVDIRMLRLEDLRRLMTVLFQFPLPYHASAAENIAFGDVTAHATPERLERAARGAGAHELIADLPQGYDTYLGKWFADGTELSGGEWQRVATARAYFRDAPIVVLDEPTSAMDSWSEADWFERLRALTLGRTALIITHRFTIAMRADVIHVMDGGHIVESGTHDQLLVNGGLYAQSWQAQVEARRGMEPSAATQPSLDENVPAFSG